MIHNYGDNYVADKGDAYDDEYKDKDDANDDDFVQYGDHFE